MGKGDSIIEWPLGHSPRRDPLQLASLFSLLHDLRRGIGFPRAESHSFAKEGVFSKKWRGGSRRPRLRGRLRQGGAETGREAPER